MWERLQQVLMFDFNRTLQDWRSKVWFNKICTECLGLFGWYYTKWNWRNKSKTKASYIDFWVQLVLSNNSRAKAWHDCAKVLVWLSILVPRLGMTACQGLASYHSLVLSVMFLYGKVTWLAKITWLRAQKKTIQMQYKVLITKNEK